MGVLFFNKGELYDARIDNIFGKNAAYEIFSWEKVSLSIQDDCAVKDKRIKEELQTILFDAMRMKDESGEEEAELLEATEPDPAPLSTETSTRSNGETIRQKLEKVSRGRDGIDEIYEDDSWNEFVDLASALGKICQAGKIRSCYVDDGRPNKFILMPGEETIVVSVKPDCPGDIIMKILYD